MAYRPGGILAGALLCGIVLAAPRPEDMPEAAWHAVAVAGLMVVWWITEAVPVAATALVPIVSLPLLGVAEVGTAAAPYADPVIFLFLGGLMLGLAIQRCGLHRRIALAIVRAVGMSCASLVFGFMAATAFLSMWVSNTATAAMMLPVGVSTAALIAGPPGQPAASSGASALGLALLLGIAFAASIGGLATLIGTPPNALFAGFMRRSYGIEIGFAQWMSFGVPLAAVMLLGAWLILTRVAFRIPRGELPGVRQRLAAERGSLGPATREERRVALVFLGTALAWIFRPLFETALPAVDDSVIAVAAAVLLFVIPDGRGGALMDWDSAARLPWGVLLMFGGGLSLAAAIAQSGLAAWVGGRLAGAGAMPPVLLVLGLIVAAIALSELASNTATAAMLLPIAASLAPSLGVDVLTLAVPAVLAASCGFMLPVATPPNALIYGSGYVTVGQMARGGALIDLLGAGLVLAAAFTAAEAVFGPS